MLWLKKSANSGLAVMGIAPIDKLNNHDKISLSGIYDTTHISLVWSSCILSPDDVRQPVESFKFLEQKPHNFHWRRADETANWLGLRSKDQEMATACNKCDAMKVAVIQSSPQVHPSRFAQKGKACNWHAL